MHEILSPRSVHEFPVHNRAVPNRASEWSLSTLEKVGDRVRKLCLAFDQEHVVGAGDDA